MTIHYHGTPITPRAVLLHLSGSNFCVRHGEHRDAKVCHEIGQSIMLDNGAYGKHTTGKATDWPAFYEWCRPYLDFHTTWAVIPDVIGGSELENDGLIHEWGYQFSNYRQGAPVWHLHESFDRLERLVRGFDRVCFGSSGEYWQIGSPAWNNRVNEAFNLICRGSGRPLAWIHMLRGMSLSGSIYPFASVDSTDVARNHEQVDGRALAMATRWNGIQNPARWEPMPIQKLLVIA